MLNRHRSLLPVLVALSFAAGVLAAPSPASAKVKPVSAAKIIKDCKSDGEINKAYRLADLKAAQKIAKKKGSKSGECKPALTSAIAGLAGKKGKNSVSAVQRECGAGVLKKRYSAKLLQKALDNLPSDLDQYTSCSQAINSQLVTVKKR